MIANTDVRINTEDAAKRLDGVIYKTPTQEHIRLSQKYDCNLYLKREDLQIVRSYKIRGAYNKIVQLSLEEKQQGVICASAGNHAQGVALSCQKLEVKGIIVMPITTPRQKIDQVKMFGGEWVTVTLIGDTYDESYQAALQKQKDEDLTFVHPFDDYDIIEGQSTVGYEIVQELDDTIDYIVMPIGGGGLAAGVSSYIKTIYPNIKIIGVEPLDAASMKASIEKGELVTLDDIDCFVDGAAVRKVGQKNFDILKETLDEIIVVDPNEICSCILEMYNRDAIVLEPAGVMSLTALRQIKSKIKGKNVVCILSGSNNDITRMEEMKEKALLYEGVLHYFIIEFPQRAGALKEFVNYVVGDRIDIIHFQYSKRTNRHSGPVVIGLEFPHREEFEPLVNRMDELSYSYQYLNDKPALFSTLVG